MNGIDPLDFINAVRGPHNTPSNDGGPKPKPKPKHDCEKVLLLSQETACEWISCILKLGVPLDEERADICEVAYNTGIAELALPTIDGKSLESLSQNLDGEWEIRILVDQCTSCGRKILQYKELLRGVLGASNPHDHDDDEKPSLRIVKVSSSCFCL